MKEFDVVVIGAGASGCVAAISAARQKKRVLILEHLDKIGKKILSTGNGKCNYTNQMQGTSYYRGTDPVFVVQVMEQFGFLDTIDFFRELGIYPKEKNGYYYPYSEQAASVVEVLELELRRLGVTVKLSTQIEEVKKKKNTFVIRSAKEEFSGKKLIFATGLLAGRKAGCDGSAFPYIEGFGHHFIDIVPALVQMKSQASFLKNLAGIRAEICLKLSVGGREVFQDEGELLHIEKGLSGIVSFQASRFASYGIKNKKEVVAHIDYFPKGDFQDVFKLLEERFYQNGEGKNAVEALIGLYPYKLCVAFTDYIGMKKNAEAVKVPSKTLKRLTSVIKDMPVEISGTKEYADAQVCAGGVSTKEVENISLESRLVKGLYFCGEVLDIDGMCGGYNLQWAWSSGYVAGMHAAMDEN